MIEGGNPQSEILYESNEGSSGILNGLLESDLRTISGLQNGKYNITVVDEKGAHQKSHLQLIVLSLYFMMLNYRLIKTVKKEMLDSILK